MDSLNNLLEGLNPSQLKAVTTTDGTIQICSVAGSGKTRVLVHRVAYMLEQGIKPNQIMVTTFTKKAAEEMTGRLSKLITKMQMQQLTIGTTHSIGYRILAKEYANLNHPLASAFKKELLINGELKKFVREVKKGIMYDRTVQFDVKEQLRDLGPAQLCSVMGKAKNDGMDCAEFEGAYSGKGARMEAYIEFFKQYEQAKWSQRRIDADDLLILLVKLFEEHKDILAKYQRIYKYVMVDEAQDNNSLQYKLIKMIGYPENNIFVVGDDDQSMYGFRGAQPEQFIYLKDNYRNVVQIPLEDNYRSNPGILDVANKLIENNTERILKRLRAHKKDTSECVNYNHYENETEEGAGIVSEVKVLNEKEGINLKQMAVLYRTNAQSKAIEEQLIMAGLPYIIHGGISFYERKEVKDILAYIQLAVDHSNNAAFKRIYNVPGRYLGKAFFDKICGVNASHYEALNQVYLKNYEKDGVDNIIQAIQGLTAKIQLGEDATEVMNYIMKDIGYEKHLVGEDGDGEDEGNSRLENLETLRYAMSKFENIKDFLDYMNLMTSSAKTSIDGVQLMTVHKSKGLEFPVTFVAGASEGLLPHYKAVKQTEETGKAKYVEEERRLMYVAVTRAESRCYVSSLSSFGGRETFRSRFVAEMGLVAKPKEVDTEEEYFKAGV